MSNTGPKIKRYELVRALRDVALSPEVAADVLLDRFDIYRKPDVWDVDRIGTIIDAVRESQPSGEPVDVRMLLTSGGWVDQHGVIRTPNQARAVFTDCEVVVP